MENKNSLSIKKTTSCSTSCRAVVLAYQGQKGTEAKQIEIRHISSFFYQKMINSPFGEFTLELPNNLGGLHQSISVGDWIGVYLNNGVDAES